MIPMSIQSTASFNKARWGPRAAASGAVVRPNVTLKGLAKLSTANGKARRSVVNLGTIESVSGVKVKFGATESVGGYDLLVDVSFSAV